MICYSRNWIVGEVRALKHQRVVGACGVHDSWGRGAANYRVVDVVLVREVDWIIPRRRVLLLLSWI